MCVLFLSAIIMISSAFVGCSSENRDLNMGNEDPPQTDVAEEEEFIDDFNGVYKTAYEKVTSSMYEAGNQYYLAGYDADNTDLMYAEPEFAGKYMFICSILGGKYLDQAKGVVEACRKAQRADGYLGCLPKGYELDNFSVWNQAFTILGLTEYFKVTGDAEALECAVKCAEYVELSLRERVASGGKITEALNGGSQHLSILLPLARLYKATGDSRWIDFGIYIIGQAEREGFKLVSFEDLFNLKSQKGVEMLVVYIGIEEIANIISETEIDAELSASVLKDAVERFWNEINTTQIRNTGGASTGECFQVNGNLPAQLSTDMHVNENCVSVAWCELTAILFETDTRAEYLDAIEKTLLNAVLGSMATNGSDFAYYQGNFGRKEFATSAGMYKCCRTRGFNLIAELPKLMYKYDGKNIIPILYCDNNSEPEKGLRVVCETVYPQNGRLKYTIENKTGEEKILKLRIPSWCENWNCTVSNDQTYAVSNDFINIDIGEGETVIEVNFEMEVVAQAAVIDGETYHDFHYGPLLLVHDRHNGTMLKESRYDAANAITQEILEWNRWDGSEEGSWYLVQFTTGNLNLVDYASAGRADPEKDLFKTYIRGI